MHLDVIREPTEHLPPQGDMSEAFVHGGAKTVDALEPRERVRSLVAARLFGGVAAPSRVGRFELQRELGVGGMGVVYAAHDPRLDRVVALKLLQRTGESPKGGRRLLREAQAMARLRHPNVVQVYEAGTQNGQVHIAMELIQGGTLGEWMGGRPRPWSEVRDVMLAAGRGLAAAHAAGLIHRDFKPGNVLIDVDGQPRVSDFGLARGAEEEGPRPDEAEQTEEFKSGHLLEVALTRTGAILGTPAYMSPEQFRGEASTARSDQFAFCVVVWEALCGQRPFVSESIGGLLKLVKSGTITPVRGVRLPRKLRRILGRGLSPRPGDRYPSMPALLADMERIQGASRRGGARLMGATVMAAALAMGIGLTIAGGSSEDQEKGLAQTPQAVAKECFANQKSLMDAWSPVIRERLRERLSAAEGSGVDGARISGVLGAIDRRFESLQELVEERCEAGITMVGYFKMALGACVDDRREELIGMLASIGEEEPIRLHELEGLVAMLAGEEECHLEQPSRNWLQYPEDKTAIRRVRRSIAWAFAPLALSDSLTVETGSWVEAEELAERLPDPRLAAQVDFVRMVVAARSGATRVDPSLLESFEEKTARFKQSINVASGPMIDLRARVALLSLQMHKRGSNPSEARTRELAAAAAMALDQLPAEDSLRVQLSREL